MRSFPGLNAGPLPWLLEPDDANPGPRLFALRELAEDASEAELAAAQAQVMASGPVPQILAAQAPAGWWVQPGPGYGDKYRGTVWSVIFLAQLGADGRDPRVRAAGDYILEHNRSPYGGFSADGQRSGTIHCLQGNLGAALVRLGWLGDARLAEALDFLARSVTGEGIAPAEEKDAPVRYYRSGISGPNFLCSANNHQPCAWGAIKAMWALAEVPPEARTPAMRAAIDAGIAFLLGRDPAMADYPTPFGGKPNGSWFKFGYPLAYVTDVLQNLEVLTALGYGAGPRLAHAVEWLLSKQDAQGRWPMEYTYNGKTWADVEVKGQASKWVTLRALRVLKRIARA
jgi:hypothetical protein